MYKFLVSQYAFILINNVYEKYKFLYKNRNNSDSNKRYINQEVVCSIDVIYEFE